MDDTGSVRGGPIFRIRRPRRPVSGLGKFLLWTGLVIVVLFVAAVAVAAYYLHRAEPMLRSTVIQTLEKRFNAKVELDRFEASVVDGFQVEGGGLRIWLPTETQAALTAQDAEGAKEFAAEAAAQAAKRKAKPERPTTQPGQDMTGPQDWSKPWITVDSFRFHASWHFLPDKPIVASIIYVSGVRVLLPPKDSRPRLSGYGSSQPSAASATPASPNQAAQSDQSAQSSQDSRSGFFKLPTLLVRQVQCENVELVLEKGARDRALNKIPLDFQFASLTLTPDGHGGPIAFAVAMTNAKPVGLIHSTGSVGPISTALSGGSSAHFHPGDLPVRGDYQFDHADLSTIHGIAGMLSSTGHYDGTLNHIDVNGVTDTPDFRLERVHKGPGVHLTTRFHAIVDGTNGNTYLDPVDATLGHTHFIARGQVVRAADVAPGVHGHDIQLKVNLDHGRIEDILAISADADRPFITGALELQTSFHLPPGTQNVWDKLELDGKFRLAQAQFSSDSIQKKLEQLSLRGQGKPREVKTTDPDTIYSEMLGHFRLDGGSLHLPDLEYEVPGAQVLVAGTYGLRDGSMDFEGNARMDASVSKMVGGWKGILLKPVDRYLKRNGAATDVPIHLKGNRKAPEFGVDFGRVGKPDTVPSQ